MINLFHCHVSERSKTLVNEVLNSGALSEGPMVERFERALADFGLTNPVTVNSGTSALHLAMVLAGIGPGDEVILPPQTFVATGMAILYCGAKPVFADVDPDTGNIDVEDVFKKANTHTAAVVGVDWAGLPCDMADFSLISTVWDDVHFIEDAAHAFGATYKGEMVGNRYASSVIFSCQATKHLSCGDGGIYSTWNKAKSCRAKRLRWFGIDRLQEVGELGERDLDLTEPGFKYHMNDVAAAIGLGNLEGFKERLAKRQANGAFLRKEFADTPGLKLPALHQDRTHAYYVFPLLVEKRLDFCRMMKSKGIQTSVVCSRIDKSPVFGGRRNDLPGTDYFDDHQINLPVHEGLSDEDITKVVESVKGGW